MSSNYFRVIPRDLFNEGRLLTELGFLILAVCDNKEGIADVLTVDILYEERGFIIEQDETNGSLYVSNLRCQAVTNFFTVHFYTTLNCRAKNALQFRYELLDLEGAVFDGKNYDFSNKFKLLLKHLA